jgi:hypothetical protein
MPDYDAKNIPVLDDVIENGDDKKRDFDLSIESPDDETKESNLDLFVGKTSNLAVEDADIETTATETPIIGVETATEAQIGAIDNPGDEDNNDDSLYEPEKKAVEEEAEKFESALIDYTAVDKAESSSIDMPDVVQQEEEQPLEAKQQTLTTVSLQSVTDDIVKQLMPELEQHLRLLLEQALLEQLLKEKLPEDIKQSEMPSESNPDN